MSDYCKTGLQNILVVLLSENNRLQRENTYKNNGFIIAVCNN